MAAITHICEYILHDYCRFGINVCVIGECVVCVPDVLRSMLGTVVWVALIVAWVTVFQLHRADWGETADRMSFIIPKGVV